jgi:tetratricopeptide (TPR) repeat protein
MKYFLLLSLSALLLSGCANTAPPQAANQAASQSTPAPRRENELSVISHSAENRSLPANISINSPANNGSNANSTGGGGSPMSRAIDVTAMNADIQRAEKKFEKDQKDAQAKKDLAHAYFVRAFALTDAAQYRAALGDFRKGLKLDPDDKDAKNMHDRIISIFQSINREPPKEGEEPPPLPFGN